MPKNICIIPARGGSKRLPKKNIADFHGKPLIAYTIEAAIQSKLFGDNVYVSSDSEAILAVARTYSQNGVKALRRPKEISGDDSPLEDAALHLLRSSPGSFDTLCLLMPNFPLRSAEDVKGAYETFVKSGASYLMTVTDYQWLNPFWAMIEKKGQLRFFFGKKYIVDSKKLPKVYAQADAARFVKVPAFLKHKTFFGKDMAKYEIPFERSIEIDDLKDLELAKKLYAIAT